jgi:hypothetical protein
MGMDTESLCPIIPRSALSHQSLRRKRKSLVQPGRPPLLLRHQSQTLQEAPASSLRMRRLHRSRRNALAVLRMRIHGVPGNSRAARAYPRCTPAQSGNGGVSTPRSLGTARPLSLFWRERRTRISPTLLATAVCSWSSAVSREWGTTPGMPCLWQGSSRNLDTGLQVIGEILSPWSLLNPVKKILKILTQNRL